MADVNGGMGLVAPSRFKTIVPKLKASDYDYIIFDMPPVSPTSITPRMASHMDIVLLVLESEKTGQHRAAKASSLMRESRANVAAVLNKCRQHVPEALSQEL
jgi:Mrp family chromosome partitioning ATPase